MVLHSAMRSACTNFPAFMRWTLLCLVGLSIGTYLNAAPPRVVAWGDNTFGQTNVPANLGNIKAIASGYIDGLALLSNGTVVVWGDNSAAQTNSITSLTNAIAIAAGSAHCLALRSNGTVYGWGLNNYGQATPPTGLTNVIAIACGANHSVALRSNGTVVAWGYSFNGETNVPPSATNVVAISAGDAHCLALRKNGTLIAWGDNASGQTNIPAGLTNVMAIAAGYHHNLALLSNGTVVAWELNVYGESTVPAGLSNVVAVDAGYFHSMALRSDGSALVWGQNFSGQTNVPPGLSGVISIAAGSDHDLALTTAPLCTPGLPDNFECRQTLAGSSISNIVSNVGATRETGEPTHAGVVSSNSIWFSWTAPFSGGVVITALSGFDFASPILAVYSGTNLAGLTSVAFNVAPFGGSGSPLNESRVVFTAVTGQTYQIALDGKPTPSFESQGSATLLLNMTPPPTNDLFANSIPISGTFYQQTNATFIGASRETGEPTHGTTMGQTLWWNWLAPTYLNVSNIQVRLTADAVSFPPAIGIYTGSFVSSLSPVPILTTQSNGMTRVTTFSATPGVIYRVALAGIENDLSAVLPLTGNYRFRLNAQGLAVAVTNLLTTSNADGTMTYSATHRVSNVGSAVSNPLRLRTFAVPGASMRGTFETDITDPAQLQSTISLIALSPGQSTNVQCSGTVPAPGSVSGGASSALGYGIYVNLEEQSGTNWVTIDQALVTFGNWPDFTGQPGPGGGVIRLDPGYVGLSTFDPLLAVSVLGPNNVVEGNQASFFGRASYASGSQLNFTNTVWLSSLFSITNGLFSSGIVTSNTSVSVTARYSSSGFAYDALTNVTVINLPPPQLSRAVANGGNFTMQITGVSNRLHVIEATIGLTPPAIWQPVATNNLGPSGIWNFTNSMSGFPQRFFRARETQ